MTYLKNVKDVNLFQLVCSLCKIGFYLDDNGKCIKFVNYLEKIPNCYYHTYQFENFTIYYYNDNNMNYRLYNNDTYEYDYFFYYNEKKKKIIDNISSNLKKINHRINGNCLNCNDGYFFNSDK